MGVSTSPAQLAGKFAVAAAAMSELPRVQIKAGGETVKKAIEVFAPSRLRGVGRGGAALNVRVSSAAAGGDAAAKVTGVGPWALIERNTRPHQIPRQVGRGRYAVIPGVGVRAWAHHPGTRGQHPWEHGVVAAVPVVRKEFEASTRAVLGRIF